MVKRYFVTNTLKSSLPLQFVTSKAKKYISFIHCRLVLNNALIGDVSIHSDLITDLPYLNYFVSFVNVDIAKRKKWEMLFDQRDIRVWFQDLNGSVVAVNDGDFVLELLLEY